MGKGMDGQEINIIENVIGYNKYLNFIILPPYYSFPNLPVT